QVNLRYRLRLRSKGLTFVIATFALSSNGMAAELPKNGPIEGRFYSHAVEKIDEALVHRGR
ncbi:MAG TPA: hypothetical protein VKB76_01850, partial [Ktedonobacterales bacterium]|nr:hypothetical protein [Ktedonobacterales bacterium]